MLRSRKGRKPRVQPVRRYRVPDYPSHQDPDPTRHPYPLPYPLSPRLAAAITGIGLALGCDGPPEQGRPPLGPGPQPLPQAGEGDTTSAPAANPLPVSTSGLPHRTSPFGTGAPSYLDDELAREVIDRVFQQEGYSLQSDYAYAREGDEFVADGFDPERGVGYIFGRWNNLGRGAIVSWQTESMPQAGQLGLEVERLGYQLFQVPQLQHLSSRIEEAKQLTEPQAREEAYRGILAEAERHLLSLDEAQRLEQPREKEFVAVISQFDQRFLYNRWESALAEDYERARQIADPAKREAALEAVRKKELREPLERLEATVREYISWARSQGLQ